MESKIEIIAFVILCLAFLFVVFFDLRLRKIPNWLTFSLGISGLIYQSITDGFQGLLFGIGGLGTGIGLLLIFYLKGGMGAGDVKLMGAVGTYLGAKGVFDAFLATSIVGGLYAIFTLGLSGDLRITLKRYWLMLKTVLFTGQFSYIPPTEKVKAIKMPYGVAITIGTFLTILS